MICTGPMLVSIVGLVVLWGAGLFTRIPVTQEELVRHPNAAKANKVAFLITLVLIAMFLYLISGGQQ